MDIKFRVVQASKCPKKDIITAIDIYCKTVDGGSLTNTNQIKDYIWNVKGHQAEPRSMFFYLLYNAENKVEGFAELGYLPKNQVLVLDYLCTNQRSNVQFYCFYSLVLQDIESLLKRKQQFIRYLVTELSLRQNDGKLLDIDSNYFRHLLSNENYRLLKYPYYQPALNPGESAQEFNLAMKLYSTDNNCSLVLTKEIYLSIVHELYDSHYVAWYKCFVSQDEMDEEPKFNIEIENLLKRIESEIPKDLHNEAIAMVQCQLFEEGQCPKITAENYTIARSNKRRIRFYLSITSWIAFSVLTFVLCIIPALSTYVARMCSFLTILAGGISIFTFRRDFFCH